MSPSVDPISTTVAVLQLGTSVIGIANALSEPVKGISVKIAFQLGVASGSLKTNADEVKMLLKEIKRTQNQDPTVLTQVERAVRSILKDIQRIIELFMRILTEPTLLRKLLVKVGIIRSSSGI